MRRKITRGLLLVAIVPGLTVLAAATARRIWPAPSERIQTGLLLHVLRPAPFSFPEMTPAQEFREVATRLRASDNEFLGEVPYRKVEEQLASDDLSAGKRCQLQGELARHLLRLGKTSAAVTAIEEAVLRSRSDASVSSHLPSMLRIQAIVHLRQAEQQNCIDRHCCQSCIFPIERGGVHQRRSAATRARRALEEYLQSNPDDKVGMSWILNVLNMTLGEYPDGVPEAYRLDASSWASTATVDRFVDIAPQVRLNRLSLAGGVAVDDFDGDGRLDIVSSTTDPDGPLALYRNRGDGHFENTARQAGLADQLGGLHCEFTDYNNDGLLDIFVLRGAWFGPTGRIRNSLLKNQGDGTFLDITRQAGLAEPACPTQTGVWGDFDNDGHLDLYVGNESLDEVIGLGAARYPSQLFRNNGDDTFTDVAEAAGVAAPAWVKGAAAADYDSDGDLDLYVSVYATDDAQAGRNRLYRNNGDLTFTDVAEEMGVIEPMRSFATWWFDYDNDGWIDLFVCPFSPRPVPTILNDFVRDRRGQPFRGDTPRLYRNRQGRGFEDVAASSGLKHPYFVMGCSFGDIDNDGFLDIYLGTGAPAYEAIVPNILLRNDRGGGWRDVTTVAGVGHLQKGHGIAFADFDNDGDQEIYADLGGFFPGDKYTKALFLNPGRGERFLVLKLVGRRSNRLAYGARVAVETETDAGPVALYRWVGAISSFGSTPSRLEIGLGQAKRITRLEITWPASGRKQTFFDVPMNQLVRITEGETVLDVMALPEIDFESHLRAADTAQLNAATP